MSETGQQEQSVSQPGTRGIDDDAKRQAALEAARAAHAPHSTVSKRVAGFAYGIIAGSVVLVTIAGYFISGMNGAIFAFVISLGAVVVGGIPIWLANRSQARERARYAQQAQRRASRRAVRSDSSVRTDL